MKRLLIILLAVFLNACEESTVEVPDYEKHGNIMALLTPGEALKLEAAITGVDLEVIKDPGRLRSKLFEDGQLVDQFGIESDYKIQWGKHYRLEVLIDGNYSLSSAVTVPDSVEAYVIDTVKLNEPVTGRHGQQYYAKKTVVFKGGSAGGVDSLYFHEEQHVIVHSVEVLSNDQPYLSVPAAQGDTIEFHTHKPWTPVAISLIGKHYANFLRAAELNAELGELSPQPVSYTNIEGGAGVMSIYYPFSPH